jgi:tRNA 2-selenouridine synthase
VLLNLPDFLKLRRELPTIDVRSEGEFQQGHIPSALNIPILNNAERVAVGTDYKQKGQLEAIKTGFKLVGPRIVDIVNEAERAAQGKELLVHCWRGGMRSSNFCQFVEMAKIKTHQLKGGYKAYRQDVLSSFQLPLKLIVVGGYTGSGKSEILHALGAKGEQVIDLEALANHKGSVFGALSMPAQPTNEQFQNNLFDQLLMIDRSKRVWIEDESITIGNIILPDPLWRQICGSPLVVIDCDKGVRIERLVHEYSRASKDEFIQCMSRITKKLGGQNFQAARDKVNDNNWHEAIDILLGYYDKTYGIGLNKKSERVKARVTWNGADPDTVADQLITQVNDLHQNLA